MVAVERSYFVTAEIRRKAAFRKDESRDATVTTTLQNETNLSNE